MNQAQSNIVQVKLHPLLLLMGLAGIVLSLLTNNLLFFAGIVCIPLIGLFFIQTLRQPIHLFLFIFTLNYYLMGITRYGEVSGISFLMDTLMALLIVLIFIHSALFNNIDWKKGVNTLTVSALVWMIYSILQIGNPTGMTEAWILSRGLIMYGFIVSLVASLLCDKYKTVKLLLFLLSLFTITAVLKVLMQKYIGFDSGEMLWLNRGGAKTHLIGTGTRYFSFFTDAGNFGSNMGCAGVLFAITALHVRKAGLKIYYAFVAIISLYAMFLSGTRGAMIVPLAGVALYTVCSKNTKAMVTGGISLMLIYVFFAFTTIGQGNAQIRRMRTAFSPSEDASFNVRKDNQEKLGAYLKDKPFGEGLGLSGVENQKTSMRFTTSIPHDSWYVKIWVETGIVGLILYLGMIFITIGRGAWILMFNVRDPELKGRLCGVLCGIFGLFLSAYGNAFWGQYPTAIIGFTGLSLVLNAECFDKEIDQTTQSNDL